MISVKTQHIKGKLNHAVKYVCPKLTNLIVKPTTDEQTFNHPDYDGYDVVTVEAVDSTIDTNIIPENIKAGVSILGVEGTIEDSNILVEDTTLVIDIGVVEGGELII